MILRRQYNPASGEVSSIELLASSFQNSNRNKLGNRNARNTPDINNIIFSNRNKTGGVVGENRKQFTNVYPEKPTARVSKNQGRNGGNIAAEGVSSIQSPASSLQNSNREELGNRNLRNSPIINDIFFPNKIIYLTKGRGFDRILSHGRYSLSFNALDDARA